MADFAVVHAAATVSTAPYTQDFTVSGFGTPKGAIVMTSRGVTDGTKADHAYLSVGFTDGTRSRCLSFNDEDNVNPTDSQTIGDRSNLVRTMASADGSADGIAVFSAWITDGLRINWTDAPPSAYQMTVILIGGAVTDLYVDDFGNGGGVGTPYSITAPGFQGDLAFFLSQSGGSFGGALNSDSIMTFGVGIRDGASPPTQRMIGTFSNDAQATTDVLAQFGNDCIASVVSSGADKLELTSFDATGFTVTDRVANTAGGIDFAYMVIKGVTPALVTFTSPVTAISKDITGAGWTPQFGLIMSNALSSVAVDNNTPGSEAFGIGAFTTTAQGCAAVWMDDSVTPSNTESIADSKPIRLRNGAADFITASFTSFNSDGATLNFATVDTTARENAVLFIKASGTPPMFRGS